MEKELNSTENNQDDGSADGQMDPNELRRNALLSVLALGTDNYRADMEYLNKVCFNARPAAPWSDEDTVLLLRDLECRGEIAVLWRPIPGGGQVPVSVALLQLPEWIRFITFHDPYDMP